MIECEECGKKLGIFEGYRHPTMGKNHFLCNPCFDQVEESMEKWEEFVMSNSFAVKTSKTVSQLDWKTITPNFNQIQNIIDEIKAEKGILIQE